MRIASFVVLMVAASAATAQDKPKSDEPKPESSHEVTISLADTAKTVTDQIKGGSVVDIIVEEVSSSPSKTVFYARRVTTVVDDKKKKDGHTITVKMTGAQVQAFEALKGASKVTVEMHKTKETAKDKK